MRRHAATFAALVLLAGLPTAVRADDDTESPTIRDGREYLVPALADDPFHVGDGPRPYRSRIAFTPGGGSLGGDRFYALRASYNPASWLGWEASISHTPGEATHAALHTFSALVRHPLPWRAQPYARAGYGMILVYPGQSIKADPVTENALTLGGGFELYVRDDVALRFETNAVTVIGGERDSDESVAYQYRETFFALSFYRGLGQ
ncbi:MAG: hypothetical protein R3B81_07090 [bacterium]